nr:SWIM zinc finger family protein [Kribbella solani]
MWDVERVLGLASDAASVKAGRGVAGSGKWTGSGATERAVWGLCRGSGKEPYQCVVDLGGPAYKCSCPSRKFPCKHALGLMLRWVNGEVQPADEPDWVRAWMDQRDQRAERPERKPGEVVDPIAAQQRAARRADRVSAGLAELASWLDDQVRQGLGAFDQRAYSELSRLAARMVDAQAPGVAGAVRRAAAAVGRGHDWPGELLEELALIHLIVSAHGRLAELPPSLADTVQSRIGWTTETARVLAEGEKLEDDWLMLGRVIEPDEHLTVRRVWLRGATTGRLGLLLTFAAGGRPLDPLPARPGEYVPGALSFYPGALPMRALLTQSAPREPAPRPNGLNARQALAAYVESLAADPWNERWPLVLQDVRPARHGEGWALVDGSGAALELLPGWDAMRLLAVSAGDPITVAGEWNRAGLRPMTCWQGDRAVTL